jgi:23S rRNA (guanosine2251-2'-O)-methyltransferase
MDLICGINPVMEALSAGARHFDRLLVVKGLRNRRISDAISRAGNLGIPLRFESRETLDRMASGIPHQGLIAVVSAKPVVSVEKILEEARTPALVVVLDGVEDPRNLGAILRTVEAAGADGVLLPDRHSAGLSETVSRASAGGLEHVKVASIGNVVQSIEALKARGLWVVGFDASGTERWDAVDYRRPIALVLGGEGRGIRRLVREHCDHLVSIPLFGHVNSLNVSVAAGIALYEIVRQRGAVPSHVRPIPIRAASGPGIVGPSAEDAESDPGLVARTVAEADDYEEDDESRAEPVGMGEDEDRPAWSGPTVLKPVMGPRREHGGRGRHGPTRGPRRGPGPGSRPPGPGGPPPGGDQGDRGDGRGGERDHARGGGPSGPPGPRGPRRNRRRRGGGPRPGGPVPAEGRSQNDVGRTPHEHGRAEGQDAPARNEGPVGPPPSSADGRPASPEGGGDPAKRRRRRRRRH